MLTSKRVYLKPLLESSEGTHMTVYLVNSSGSNAEFQRQLQEAIDLAEESLESVMTVEDRHKFIEPFESLIKNPKVLKQIKGPIGIFRHAKLFRLLNLPIKVEPSCHIATSFHVKPLLRWLQYDQDFVFVGINSNVAHIYSGSQNSFLLLDSLLLTNSSMKSKEFTIWLKQWISQLSIESSTHLFFAGDRSFIDEAKSQLRFRKIVKSVISDLYHPDLASDLCFKVRKYLSDESRKIVDRALTEFYMAEDLNRAKKNLFLISKAVIQGRVKKLIIADELNLFGKVDTSSGGVALHPCDLDHEDDDLLDDLAQIVLKLGGEVVVASKNEMPRGRPVLAILKGDNEEIAHIQNEQGVLL